MSTTTLEIDETPEVPAERHLHSKPSLALVLGALGVVYGDIGTSPLYALRECFLGEFGVRPTPENILGVLSLVIWSLILVVTVKYVFFVLRADNKGEGGILALLALLHPAGGDYSRRTKSVLVITGLFGAALLYGDGVITPAISVLSAVEGLNVATPIFEPFILPITIGILFALFWAQKRGTHSIGKVFGPIVVFWFLTLALLGAISLPSAPVVLKSFNPFLGLYWLLTHGGRGFQVLAGVFLVCTGAEALYADMGHFGREPIKVGWIWMVFPCLVLNYLGQGALLLSSEPGSITNPFYQLAPSWAIIPLVILSTAATVIASQALISGAFSLTMQAVQLGYLPRLKIEHTSEHHQGQIYVPFVNWTLLVVAIILVLEFRTSSNLAATYGTAVSMTMLMTTFLMYFAAKKRFGWSHRKVILVSALFGLIDLGFFSANSIKFLEGGWFPLLLGVAIFTAMSTWFRGREILAKRIAEHSLPLADIIDSLEKDEIARVPGTAIYMSRDINLAPMALIRNLKHNRVMHQSVIFLQVNIEEIPNVSEENRIEMQTIREGFYRIKLSYGFMEDPNVPAALLQTRATGPIFDLDRITFFLGREMILPTAGSGMTKWREYLFSVTTSLATRATVYFQIPPQQVVEIGYQIEI